MPSPARLALAWLAVPAMAAGAFVALRRAGRGRAHAGPWGLACARLRADRAAMAALFVILLLYATALLAPWLAPYDPIAVLEMTTLKNLPPSLAHPFGTDPTARDVLSRMLYGARVSLTTALLAMLVAMSVGTAYGAVAGYAGGRVDAAMMRVVDAGLSIPRILLLIAVNLYWQTVSVPALVLLIGLTGWFGVSRIVRAQVLAARGHEYVAAARALGAPDRRILWRHIVPNVLAPVIVAATLNVGNVIILEAGLSYLGLGVRQPWPSWGSILRDAQNEFFSVWWAFLFPGVAIVLTVMAFNILGEGLRDALDPRSR